MTGMSKDTIIIASSDNGGDFTSGASNHPFRGTKMTPFEGGTRVAAFISSPNVQYLPEASRGTSSHAWAHITDLFPSICGLAVRAADRALPQASSHDLTIQYSNHVFRGATHHRPPPVHWTGWMYGMHLSPL
jgi:arylsulfatase A-like enzyme